MAVYIRITCLIITLGSFGEGQNYYIPQSHEEYLTNQDDDTAPPVPYYQNPALNSANFYLPRDLQTSELPGHLQQTLPQYTQPIIQPSVPFPFRLNNQYVLPSTHRPDYSHVLPHRFNSFEKPLSSNNQLNLSSDDLDGESKTKIVPKINNDPAKYDNKGTTNRLDSHFTKRDSTEELEKDSLYEDEDPDQPNEKEGRNVTKNDSQNPNNQIDDPEYDEEYEYDDEDYAEEDEIDGEKQIKNETYEVLTLKPLVTSPDMLNDFADESVDTTTEHLTSYAMLKPPIASSTKKHNFSENVKTFPELVVSVVTSKTIENNTIISPVTVGPLNMSEISVMGSSVENSTDSWIVIASVQTSRSISGAHYIPSSIVDQNEKRLNELNTSSEQSVTDYEKGVLEIDQTTPITPSNVAKIKTSTESLIDKLDRVQSDLSSGLLTGGFKNDNIAVIDENLSTKLEAATETTTTGKTTTLKPYPQIKIRKFDATNRLARPTTKKNDTKKKFPFSTSTSKLVLKQADSSNEEIPSILKNIKPISNIDALLPPGYKLPASEVELSNVKLTKNMSSLLPSGYKPSITTENISLKIKPVDDISALLPPGYKIHPKIKPIDDISALLPPGYKSNDSAQATLPKIKPIDDISALLPPGYKPSQKIGESADKTTASKVKQVDDISAFLPPGYKTSKTDRSTEKSISNILSKAKQDDIGALLPPGYRGGFSKNKVTTTTALTPLKTGSESISANILPPGYKLNQTDTDVSSTAPTITSSQSTSTASSGFKVVFPSRPGGGIRKTTRPTTPRVQNEEINKPTSPTIQKGWPVRASTEFTGWPTPSTTPISIEKLLEAARAAATSTSTAAPTESSSTTTTTTTTTTTPRPTTPGICADDCDLAGTIKLVGGAKWVPELLDPNTKEYQILANSVQSELENIYNSSPMLKKWYRKIRIDGFSEGSILVDYLVEFNEVGHKVDTQEIKKLFHESLTEITNGTSNREGKSLNESKAEKLTLGQFEVDPKYTDFVVIPKHSYPTVGYAEDVLLPQWAIAVIVIGLASLLFVIIFGVTVLINRHKSAKKTPAPLTEDMLNELNKNHMGGLENYGVDDFYNMEDVWSDKHYEQKPQRKRTNGSLYDNSTTNLYDSWRSQWNGQWNAYNTYMGHGSQHSGHSGFRRPSHDTNF